MIYSEKKINIIIMALVLLDVVLATAGFCFPELWFKLFHGVDYVDPQGFLRRCAANWTAFAIIQFLALVRWKKEPFWLVMVAAVRFSDVFTDMTCLWFCSDITLFGRISLFGAGPANFLFGLYFFLAYKKLSEGK